MLIHMNRITPPLEDLPAQIWSALEAGATGADEAFRTVSWRLRPPLPTPFAWWSYSGLSLSERRLVCYSDSRARKVQHIQLNPKISWVFYDPRTRTQIRADGIAAVHVGEPHRSPQLAIAPAGSADRLLPAFCS